MWVLGWVRSRSMWASRSWPDASAAGDASRSIAASGIDALASVGEPREAVNHLATRAKMLVGDGEYADARTLYSEILTIEPSQADATLSIEMIDKQTFAPMYSFAYDQKGELWKILWHNKRWSEDKGLVGTWYEGWEGVEQPRDLVIVSDMIANVQTGTGNRIEVWDAAGLPFKSKGKIRRFIDVGRLTKGR